MKFSVTEWRRRIDLSHQRTERTLKALELQLNALEQRMVELRVLLVIGEDYEQHPES